MMVSIVEAKTSNEQPNSEWDYTYNHDEPISFKERGIKFFIFPDGEMDFDIHANDYGTTTEYYYKSNKGKSNAQSKHNRRRVAVTRDYRGRVIRVGRVFINYNYRGDISRIGSVFIRYRRNRMTQVGGLRIIHDRYGVRYIGHVKRISHYNTGYYGNYYNNFYNDYFYNNFVYDFEDDFFNGDDFFNDYEQFNEDDDYYYYRSKGSKTKHLKGKRTTKQKMIKRKKVKSDKREKRKVRQPKKVQPRG